MPTMKVVRVSKLLKNHNKKKKRRKKSQRKKKRSQRRKRRNECDEIQFISLNFHVTYSQLININLDGLF